MCDSFRAGDVVKQNTLERLGCHVSYRFFKVTHVTQKGNPMGFYLPFSRKNENINNDFSTDVWFVETSFSSPSKRFRLPRPSLWTLVTEEEKEYGIRATSCAS